METLIMRQKVTKLDEVIRFTKKPMRHIQYWSECYEINGKETTVYKMVVCTPENHFDREMLLKDMQMWYRDKDMTIILD